MTTELQPLEADRSVLRWGGLAGVAGGALLIAVFVIVGVFVGAPAADPAAAVMRFPEIRLAHSFEEVLYLGVLALWAIHFVALHRALRGTSPAPALFGRALGLMGLTVLAAGALPQVARTPIADLFHAPGATAADQATLALLWQATQGMLEALLVAGMLLLPIALLLFGVAMLKAPAFGRGYGWLGVGLGAVASAAATAQMVAVSEIAVLVMLALIVFSVAVGWKLFRSSGEPAAMPLPAGIRL
jgi:hypothetical protein